MAKKRKLSRKQLAGLAKGRAILKSRRAKKKSSSRRVKTISKKVRKVAKRKAKRRTSKQSRGMFANVSGMLGAIAYGAVREQISDAVANSRIGQQLPVTAFTDEAVMLGINWAGRKFGLGKNPIGNSILRAQKTIELGRIGAGIRDVMANRKMVSQNGNNANGLVVLS